jgi:hypothetical protein
VNTALPRALARIGGHEVRVPQSNILGDGTAPAGIPGILVSAAREAADCDAVLASGELLVFGGSAFARLPAIGADEAVHRAERALASAAPYREKLTLFAASSPPAAGAGNAVADPLANSDARREVLLYWIEALRRGRIAQLVFLTSGARDDVPRGDLAHRARGLPAQLLEFGDDACAMLASAALLDPSDRVVPVAIVLSDAPGLGRIAPGEPEPFRESLHARLRTLGIVVEQQQSEAELFLHPPVPGAVDLWHSPEPPRGPDLAEFVELLRQSVASGRTVFLADCGHRNGADPHLLRSVPREVLGGLGGFAAWGSPPWALGTVLCQIAMVASARRSQRWSVAESQQLTKLRLIDDWLYQTIVRTELKIRCERASVDPARLGTAADPIEQHCNERLRELAQGSLPFGTPPFRARFHGRNLHDLEIVWL